MKKIFIFACMITLLIPFAGMLGFATTETAEKTELAAWPDLCKEGSFNSDYLSEMGEYFEDHFAFRSWMVTAYANLEKSLLHTSSNDQVTIGKEDWLFYNGSLLDYRQTNQLSERQLGNIVHNLSLMYEQAKSDGADFLFVIAPNKNSIYPEYMPYYEKAGNEKSDAARLLERLEEADIPAIDLFEILESEKENQQLYYKTDSHWNNTGAYIAYTNMMQVLHLDAKTYDWSQAEEILHTGDLEEMLCPETIHLQKDVSIRSQTSYALLESDEEFDEMNNLLQTSNAQGNGRRLLMYRDSFGSALFDYMADTFDQVFYTRLTPYNMYQVQATQSDVVIIERVERRLAALEEQAALITPVQTENLPAGNADENSWIQVQEKGDFMYIQGEIDSLSLEDDTQIYISMVQGNGAEYTFEPFYTNENGFEIYLPLSWFDENTTLLVHHTYDNTLYSSARMSVETIRKEENQ